MIRGYTYQLSIISLSFESMIFYNEREVEFMDFFSFL